MDGLTDGQPENTMLSVYYCSRRHQNYETLGDRYIKAALISLSIALSLLF